MKNWIFIKKIRMYQVTGVLVVGLLLPWLCYANSQVMPVTHSIDNPFGDSSHVFIVSTNTDLTNDLNQCQGYEDSEDGCAILIMPATTSYQGGQQAKVGYFTQVMGLGIKPDQTKIIDGFVIGQTASPDYDTRTFWRSLENLAIQGNETWHVSQGAPLRRIHVMGDLSLSLGGTHWTSGGFMANSNIDGTVNALNQQQWLARNSTWKNWAASSGDNGVFVDDLGTVNTQSFSGHHESVVVTDSMAEKPYLIVQDQALAVVVPQQRAKNMPGSDGWPDESKQSLPVSHFCIAKPSDNEMAVLTSCLKNSTIQGIIFTPGVHKINLTITKPNFVVLGLGFPKLHSLDLTQPALTVQAKGVRLAGLMFEAWGEGPYSPSKLNAPLLEIDKTSDNTGAQSYLYDIFVRVIAKENSNQHPGILIKGSHVVLDDVWIWAKDNNGQVGVAQNGLEVDGNYITVYGLAVEHFFHHQTLWNGENGAVYFYQSELPYDTQDGGPKLPSSFTLDDRVKNFSGVGMGVYSVVGPDIANDGVSIPSAPNVKINTAYSWTLQRSEGGKVTNVVGEGGQDMPGTCSDQKCYVKSTLQAP